MKKRLFCAVCALIAAATAFSGCSANKIYLDNGNGEKQSEYTFVSDEYIVKNGKSDYVIVVENNPSSELKTAASELTSFFAEATGVSLKTVQDKETTGKEKKMISLGATSYTRIALGTLGEDLGAGDYRIATKDGKIFVLGGSDRGVISGVYKLLNVLFGFEFYQKNVYELNTGVRTLNYFNADVTQKAAIAYRADYSGMNDYGSTINSTRLGLMTDASIVVGGTHNSLEVLKPEVYGVSHSAWFATSGDQLCYTAHGDEKELNEMVEVVAENLYKAFMNSDALNRTFAGFQMMDNKNWCGCAACTEAEALYGAKSGAMLKTCNMIGARVNEMLRAAGDDRVISILPLLYNATENVPVVSDGNGKYSMNPALGTLEYVTPLWACMVMKDHAKGWGDEENVAALDMLEKMNAAFENFWIWDYGVDFNDYLVPFDTFNTMKKDFEILSRYKIGLYLYQLANSARNVTGFNGLKVYLYSKLAFDPTLDAEELTDNYFANVYGAGGDAMKKIYTEYREVAIYNSSDHGDVSEWDQSIYSQSMVSEEYWKKATLIRWLGYMEEALEKTGNDGVLSSGETVSANSKATYERNIMTDCVFVKYLYAALYLTDDYPVNVAYKLKLYNDVRSLGFNHVREIGDAGENISALAEALGIAKYVIRVEE